MPPFQVSYNSGVKIAGGCGNVKLIKLLALNDPKGIDGSMEGRGIPAQLISKNRGKIKVLVRTNISKLVLSPAA